jgi:hypothetical protein
MRVKHVIPLLLCVLVMPFTSIAQELSSSGSSNRQIDQQLPVLQPEQLRQIPQSEIRDVLSTHFEIGNQSATKGLATTSALPVFGYSDGSSGTTFTGTIVGSFPSNAVATNVQTIVVPVVLNIAQGGNTWIFNPSATDPGCLGGANTGFNLTLQSPFFNNTPVAWVINGVNEGNTQFLDAFQRAEFSTIVNPANHLLLNSAVGPQLTISVANPTGAAFGFGGQCGTNPFPVNQAGVLGVVDINTVNPILQNYITANGFNPSQFVLFVLYNAVMSNGAPTSTLSNCCILGFHSTLGAGQTYGIADFDGRHGTLFTGVSDASLMAHEVGEWANDPLLNNATPAWGNTGQVSGCQANLEVGDPLSGTLIGQVITMPNGFTYHFQELAFFSWFFRDKPSLGAGGRYSSNGALVRSSQPCPPGGR